MKWGLAFRPRAQRFNTLLFLLFLLFSVWILLQILAPLFLPTGSVPDLSGVVAVSDNEQYIDQMPFPWNLVYGSGDRLCHQQAARSLFLNGNQMPFCSRCTAIWLGIALGLGLMVVFTLELTTTVVSVILLSLIPIGVDGVGQLLGFWESSNLVRSITGLFTGGVCGVALGIIIDELSIMRVFRKSKK